jgi:hypothetical protein
MLRIHSRDLGLLLLLLSLTFLLHRRPPDHNGRMPRWILQTPISLCDGESDRKGTVLQQIFAHAHVLFTLRKIY